MFLFDVNGVGNVNQNNEVFDCEIFFLVSNILNIFILIPDSNS